MAHDQYPSQPFYLMHFRLISIFFYYVGAFC
jgi:hypothetical protein